MAYPLSSSPTYILGCSRSATILSVFTVAGRPLMTKSGSPCAVMVFAGASATPYPWVKATCWFSQPELTPSRFNSLAAITTVRISPSISYRSTSRSSANRNCSLSTSSA